MGALPTNEVFVCACMHVPTGQAVVTLQLCILHGPLLLICQCGELADGGGQEAGRGLGAGVRVSQHPAQPLDLQQSAVVLADRLPVLLILVALCALALEVQRPSHDVGWFAVGWLFPHGSSEVLLLLQLQLLLLVVVISGVFGPAVAVVWRLCALLEPRGSASTAATTDAAAAVSEASSAAVYPAIDASLHRAHCDRI